MTTWIPVFSCFYIRLLILSVISANTGFLNKLNLVLVRPVPRTKPFRGFLRGLVSRTDRCHSRPCIIGIAGVWRNDSGNVGVDGAVARDGKYGIVRGSLLALRQRHAYPGSLSGAVGSGAHT